MWRIGLLSLPIGLRRQGFLDRQGLHHARASSGRPGLIGGKCDPPAPAAPNPNQVALHDNIERLKLSADQILPLHGRKVGMAEFRTWIGKGS